VFWFDAETNKFKGKLLFAENITDDSSGLLKEGEI